MASVKYYLNNKQNQKGERVLFLYFRYAKSQVVVSTNEMILPQSWDAKKQKVKASHLGYSEINNNLQKWQTAITEIYHQRIYQGLAITPKELKTVFEKIIRVDKNFEPDEKEKIGLTAFIDKFIVAVDTFKNSNTLKTYKSHAKMLKAFEETTLKKKIAFEDITLDFYHEFKKYMTEIRKYNDNTQHKHTVLLKFFLNEATDRKENTNMEYKSRRFSTPTKAVDSIYLSEDEIHTLLRLDLSANTRLEKVRDLFVIGCFTGLRFSDLTALNAENISSDLQFFKTKAIKTEEFLEIPIHPVVRKIMEKYKKATGSYLPTSISNQKMNDYLKEIGKMANLSEDVAIVEKKGNKRVQTHVSKFELITCHTARRSFATNEYLAGTPPYAIMSITGHKTEKAFLTYIKVTKKQYANQLSEIWKERYKNQ